MADIGHDDELEAAIARAGGVWAEALAGMDHFARAPGARRGEDVLVTAVVG